MEKRSIYLVVGLFGLIVVGMFTYAFLMRSELSDQASTVTPLPIPAPVSGFVPELIEGKVFYTDGEYVFAGTVTTPTPCDLLEVSVVVMESMPEQIRLDFTTLNTAEACIQVLSDQRFLTTPVRASAEANVSATFNGQPVQLNLLPALPGETPDDFELFIKG